MKPDAFHVNIIQIYNVNIAGKESVVLWFDKLPNFNWNAYDTNIISVSHFECAVHVAYTFDIDSNHKQTKNIPVYYFCRTVIILIAFTYPNTYELRMRTTNVLE